MTSDWSEELVGVPAFPPVTVKLLHELARPSVDLAAVSELVASDPALSAFLLAHANSALYGRETPTQSVSDALLRLGTEAAREVLTTIAASSCFRSAVDAEEIRRCWRHTMATAIIADEIAKSAGQFQHKAYTAALLHDLGRLALAVAYRETYVTLIQDSRKQCMDLLDHEATLFGIHHADAGCWLVDQWGLPPDFREIAGRHHDTPESQELSLLLIVHVACLLADATGFDVCPAVRPIPFVEALSRLPRDVLAAFNWTEETLAKRVAERQSRFGDVELPHGSREELTLSTDAPSPSSPVANQEPSPLLLVAAVMVLGLIVILWWPH